MLPDTARARAAKQQKDLARVRAERDDLRTQLQLMARVVQVLEIENHQLEETRSQLEAQLASHTAVADFSRRRR
ncbi:hypothetical protein AB0A94_37760 [Streptomyces sp. NPDC044984]|uniref:hypothetical protein n=1 Tax=Streptomyces sp. NPDC044984 TaxID=3154335 RepID=UPI0033CB9D97